MKTLRLAKVGYLIISCLFYFVGISYMFLPDLAPLGVCIFGGIVLLTYGVIKIIGYFSKDLYCLAFQYDLAFGLFIIVLGIIVLSCSSWILPYLSVGLGALILLDSLLSIQMSKDARQFGLKTWTIILATSIIAGVFGVLVIVHPFHAQMAKHFIGGGALLADGVKNHCVIHLTVRNVSGSFLEG